MFSYTVTNQYNIYTTETDVTIDVTRVEICGDDMEEGPSEQCDDGNLDPNDGCDGSCQLEPFEAIDDTLTDIRPFGTYNIMILDNDVGVGSAYFEIDPTYTGMDIGTRGTIDISVDGTYLIFTPNTNDYPSQSITNFDFTYRITNRWQESIGTVSVTVQMGLICTNLPQCRPNTSVDSWPVCVNGQDVCRHKSIMNGNNNYMTNSNCMCCDGAFHWPNLCCVTVPFVGQSCFDECCWF